MYSKCLLIVTLVSVFSLPTYLDEVVRAKAQELQQLKVAARRQDVLYYCWLQENLTRGDKQSQTRSTYFCLRFCLDLMSSAVNSTRLDFVEVQQ